MGMNQKYEERQKRLDDLLQPVGKQGSFVSQEGASVKPENYEKSSEALNAFSSATNYSDSKKVSDSTDYAKQGCTDTDSTKMQSFSSKGIQFSKEKETDNVGVIDSGKTNQSGDVMDSRKLQEAKPKGVYKVYDEAAKFTKKTGEFLDGMKDTVNSSESLTKVKERTKGAADNTMKKSNSSMTGKEKFMLFLKELIRG